MGSILFLYQINWMQLYNKSIAPLPYLHLFLALRIILQYAMILDRIVLMHLFRKAIEVRN